MQVAGKSAAEEDVRGWAKELIRLEDTDAIVTPVVVEFLAGVRSSHELKLTRVFLSAFRVIDGRKILDVDWSEAERLASRVPRDGKPRDLGDCLIQAIGTRLRYEVGSMDRRFRDHRRNNP